MGKKEKLIEKLKGKKNFSYEELVSLLQYFSYYPCDKGRTSGSRVMFVNCDTHRKILLHKPHTRNYLLEYQIKQILNQLKQEGYL